MEAPPPPVTLYRLATAHYVSAALHAASKLGVADHLADGPRSAEALADATGTHAPSLRRMLRLLVTEGVFVEREDGTFESTPVGDALQRGRFDDAVQLFAGPSVWRTWGDMEETVRTGEPAFPRVFGCGPFEYFRERPDEGAAFDRAMASFTEAAARTVAQAYDFSELRRICDVGGGNGALLAGVLRAHPHLEGAVFDLPPVAERARAALADLGERADAIAGDFFEAVPAGFDAYLIKHVIHDWDDAPAARILGRVREAIGDGDGRLLLIENLYPERVEARFEHAGAARNDCNMMLIANGRQRSESELRALYAEAGFELTHVVATPTVAIVEGRATRSR